MSDADDLRDLAGRPFSGLVKDAVVLTPDFARRIAAALAARSTPVPASNVSEGLRAALKHALYSDEQTHGAHLTHQEPCAEYVVGDCVVRAALAHAAPEGLDIRRSLSALFIEYPEASPVYRVGMALLRELDNARLPQPDATEEAGRPAREYPGDHHWTKP